MKHLKLFALLLFSIVIFSKTSFASETELQITDKNHILIVDSTNENITYSTTEKIFCPYSICHYFNNPDMWGYVLLNNSEKSVLNLLGNDIYELNAILYLNGNKYGKFDEIPYGTSGDGILKLEFVKKENWEKYENNRNIDYGNNLYINMPISLRKKNNELIPSIPDNSLFEFKKYSWKEIDEDGFTVYKSPNSETKVTFTNNLNEEISCRVQYSQTNYGRGYNIVTYRAVPFIKSDKEFYKPYNGKFIVFIDVAPKIYSYKDSIRIFIGGQNKEGVGEYQYKINNGKWTTFKNTSQDIKNLKPNTKYKLKVRQIKTKDHPEVLLFNKTVKTKKK